MMTSKIFSRIFISTALFFVFASCDKDDEINDSIIPGFSEFPTTITTAPGLEFVFEGIITDDIGISNVNIKYDKWYIDKYIEFDNPPKEYKLKYKFLVPADELPNTSHSVRVSATDIAGNTTTYDVAVNLDYDVINPEVIITAPINGTSYLSGDTVELNIDFSDDKALDSIIVLNEVLGYEVKMKMPENSTNYNFTSSIDIPATGVEGAVQFEAIAIDKTGNSTKKYTTIIVGEKDIIYNMYAVGGSMWWEWDQTKATQMWKNPDDEDWFVLEFYYWEGYDIKFIGQLDWGPNNWGTDPNDSSKIINSEDSGTIGFPDGDGYYHVEFNPYTLEYKYEKMTVDVEVKENMYLMGSGFVGYDLDWNPADAIPMDKDGWENPYVFTAWVELSDDTSLKFIGQTDGWGPFDCGFEVGGETTLPVNFVKCKAADGSSDLKFKGQAGWYWITFDYFLLRATIQPYE